METPQLQYPQIRRGRSCNLNCNIRFQPQNVSRLHRTIYVDEQFGIGALKFDETQRDPECSNTFGDRQADLTGNITLILLPSL